MTSTEGGDPVCLCAVECGLSQAPSETREVDAEPAETCLAPAGSRPLRLEAAGAAPGGRGPLGE